MIRVSAVQHNLARIRLNCPNQAVRDPHKAVELAKQACKLTQSKDAKYLNTLTVAYYTVKNYSAAVKTSEKALTLVKAKGDHALAAKLQKQLNQIKRALAGSK